MVLGVKNIYYKINKTQYFGDDILSGFNATLIIIVQYCIIQNNLFLLFKMVLISILQNLHIFLYFAKLRRDRPQ